MCMYETTHNQPNQDLGNQTQSREQTKWGLRQTKCHWSSSSWWLSMKV